VSHPVVVNHIGHNVSDLEASKAFYEDALGFDLWYEITPPEQPSDRLLGLDGPLGMTCAYLRRGDFVLELLHFAHVAAPETPDRVMSERGLTHLSFSVDDVDATCEAVRRHGGTVLDDTHIGVAVFVRDPDGQLLELLPMSYRDHLPTSS
jgi:lactoylglutathione lyase